MKVAHAKIDAGVLILAFENDALASIPMTALGSDYKFDAEVEISADGRSISLFEMAADVPMEVIFNKAFGVVQRSTNTATARDIADAWVVENMDAIRSSNEYVERNGLPLSGFSQDTLKK